MEESQPEIAGDYKRGLSSEEATEERWASTLPSQPNLVTFLPTNSQIDQIPQSDLNRLTDVLHSVTDGISLSIIADLKDIITNIPPKFISSEQIDKIFNGLPEIVSLSSHHNTFEIFAHIVQLKEHALLVSQRNYIQNIRFDDFETLNNETQSFISLTVFQLIKADKANLPIFYGTLFPSFFIYVVKSNALYSSVNLPAHLRLAEAFVEVCSQEEFIELFNIFTLYMWRTLSEPISAALHGMCTCLGKQGSLVQEIKDKDQIDRLAYLASRFCIQDDWEAIDVRRSALVVFEHIAAQSNVRCLDEAYYEMLNILDKNFDNTDIEIRSEGIYMFGFAVANRFFTNLVDWEPLVDKFLKLFDYLGIEDRKEWVSTFANILYFLPASYVKYLFGREDFLECLENALWFDVSEVQIRLITAIHHLIFHHPECIDVLLQNEPIITAIENINSSSDSTLSSKIEAVLSIINQTRGEATS